MVPITIERVVIKTKSPLRRIEREFDGEFGYIEIKEPIPMPTVADILNGAVYR